MIFASRKGWNVRLATEEYLTRLAERGFAEKPGLWQRVKEAFCSMLRVLGFDISVSDEDLRYILWHSYNCLERGGRDVTGLAEDVYAYLNGSYGNSSTGIIKSSGRTSRAENPIAYIGGMAQKAILQGNRNRMKLRFLNFVLSRPTSLVTVTRNVYFEKKGGERVVRQPDIPEGATAEAKPKRRYMI